MILNRIAPTIEQHLIKEHAGFRPGKSCTSQLLNFTQHIEDGYQGGMITGTAFGDLSAAYDTVNHRLLIQKLFIMRQVHQFPSFSQVEITIEEALGELTEYYRNNSLCANTHKTRVTAFHLRNREAKRSLKVS